MLDKNVALIKKAIQAISESAVEDLLGLFDDDMIFEMSGHTPFSRKAEGKPAFLDLFAEVMVHLEAGIPLEIKNIIPAGDWVICETKGYAKMKDGHPYENNYCMLWKIKDGKITYLKEYNDTQLIMDCFKFQQAS